MKKWENGMNNLKTIGTNFNDSKNISFQENFDAFNKLIKNMLNEKNKISDGGGPIAIQKQHDKNSLGA